MKIDINKKIDETGFVKYTVYMVLGIAFVLILASGMDAFGRESYPLTNTAILAADLLDDVTLISVFIYTGQNFADMISSLCNRIIRLVTGEKHIE